MKKEEEENIDLSVHNGGRPNYMRVSECKIEAFFNVNLGELQSSTN